MNLDELRRVQSNERRTDSLQNLRPSFYQEVGEYIADLKRERERAAEEADDPFASPEVNRLTDEIETATDVVEAIYERRTGKLVKQASLAAAGMPADDEGLTAEEADLFDDLVERIRTNKGRVLDVLEGAEADGDSTADETPTAGAESAPAEPHQAETNAPAPPDAADAADSTEPAREPPTAPPDADPSSESDESVSAADAMGGGPPAPDEPDSSPPIGSAGDDAPSPSAEADAGDDARSRGAEGDEEGDAVDRVTVRITRDVGSILGIDDREYTLRADDVVALPEQNATPLVKREAAEPLE